MKRFLVGGLVWASVGCVTYFMWPASKKDAPVACDATPVAVVAPPVASPPVVLSDVVEIADLDPLLDPRVMPAGGIPFDAEPTPTPAPSPAVPLRIPLANDAAPEAAPMPREVPTAIWFLF
jgi:hypothetical protein